MLNKNFMVADRMKIGSQVGLGNYKAQNYTPREICVCKRYYTELDPYHHTHCGFYYVSVSDQITHFCIVFYYISVQMAVLASWNEWRLAPHSAEWQQNQIAQCVDWFLHIGGKNTPWGTATPHELPEVLYTPFTSKVYTAQGDSTQLPGKICLQLNQRCSPVIPERFRQVHSYASNETLLFDRRDRLTMN